MPRTTRSKAAALLDAESQTSREPFDEVNVNVDPIKQPTRATRTRARKASSKDESENTDILASDDARSNGASSVISTRSSRSTRSRKKATEDEAVEKRDVEVDIYEITIKRSTRTSKRVPKAVDSAVESAPLPMMEVEVVESSSSAPTRRTRGAAKKAPVEDVPVENKRTTRRTRKQAPIEDEQEPTPAKTVSTPSPTPRKPMAQAIQPRVSPVRKPAVSSPKTTSPVRITAPLASTTPKSTVTASRSVIRSVPRVEAESSRQMTPGRTTVIPPIAKRLAAFENNSTTSSALGRIMATPPASLVSKPKETTTLGKSIELTTPIRPTAPVSLSTIKKNQVAQNIATVSAPTFATPVRASTIAIGSVSKPTPKLAVSTPSSVRARPVVNITPAANSSSILGLAKSKPVPLGSPFMRPPGSIKKTPRVTSISAPLGGFASPTKAHLARQSLSAAAVSARNNQSGSEGDSASSAGQSMVVNIHKQSPDRTKRIAESPGRVRQPVIAPSVLRKKAPVVTTTKAALLRAQKVGGKPIGEATVVASASSALKAMATVEPPRPRAVVIGTTNPSQNIRSSRTTAAKAQSAISEMTTSKTQTRRPTSSVQSKDTATRGDPMKKPVAPRIIVTRPASELSKRGETSKPVIQTQAKLAAKPSVPMVSNPRPKEVAIKEPEATKASPVKPVVVEKKPFQPVKSTKPLTVPIPFPAAGPTKTDSRGGSSKSATTNQAPAASSIRDRISRFEAPKSKPKPTFTEARVLLREARKDARKGILPQLTGEVEYAELPEVTAPINKPEPELPVFQPKAVPIVQPRSVPVAQPKIIPVQPRIVPVVAEPQPVKPNLVRPISPAKPVVTHEAFVISGIERQPSPTRSALSDDFDSIRKAKERAEASLRGHQAVLEWANRARGAN